LRFKGGKGVATSAGVLIGVAPAAFGFGIGVFAILFTLFRYVSLGSICASVVVPLSSYFLYREGWVPDPRTYVLCVLGLIVIWRHKENIKRLLKGTENRIEFGRKDAKKASASEHG
jgi:glycerol-3-phosphate acyltransferase PlsY